MKAHLIISTEYKANQPSVFIYSEGKYYGCQIYPMGRNYPQDLNYWNNSTCSDDGRYFSVEEVEYSDTEFALIKELQEKIFNNESKLKDYPKWEKGPDYTSKKGKAYKVYLAWYEEEQGKISEITKHNAPFDKVIYTAKKQLRELLLSKRYEN